MNMDISSADWRKSNKSNTVGNQCVEVAALRDQPTADTAR